MFVIPYNTHCNLVHLIAQDSSIRMKLHKRYLKFCNSTCKSNNTLVSMMFRIVINGSGSAACRSVNFIGSTQAVSVVIPIYYQSPLRQNFNLGQDLVFIIFIKMFCSSKLFNTPSTYHF